MYLKNVKAYISGPIEHGSETNWRTEPKNQLRTRFGLDVFDPFEDPKQQWVPALSKAREEKDYDSMIKIAKRFVRKDLSVVQESRILIAYLPFKVPTVGTVHEIINSNSDKRPTLLVTDQNDIGYLPLWYFGFIKKEFMFPNWDALYEYLAEVDRGEHRDNDRWSLVYGDL